MRFIADVRQDQFEVIEKLVKEEKYKTVAQFISTAIDNQLHLEKENFGNLGMMAEERIAATDNSLDIGRGKEQLLENIGVPLNYSAVHGPENNELVYVFPDAGADKNWLWGQYNRIFPVKVGLRILIRMLNGRQWIDLEKFKEEASLWASKLEAALRHYEDHNDIPRDRRISTGLPTMGDLKSIKRYETQFLPVAAFKDGKKRLNGAMAMLKFVNIVEGDDGRALVGITDAGAKFASQRNPVLDAGNFSCGLSEDESSLYIEHLKESVPGEYEGALWMLGEVEDGHGREALNAQLIEAYKSYWPKNISPENINTQRSGMISRLYELGLIEKEKKGVSVEYRVSERGGKLLGA